MTALAADYPASFAHLIVVGLFGLVALAYLGAFVVTLVSVLRAPIGVGMTIVWVVLIFTSSILGIVLWWVVGRRDATERVAVTRPPAPVE